MSEEKTIQWKPQDKLRPYYVVIPERMANLCEAIKDCNDPDYIILWATELAELGKALKALNRVRQERFI